MSKEYHEMRHMLHMMREIYAHRTAEFTRHCDRFEQWQSEERLRIEPRLTKEAEQADHLLSMQEFEMRKRRDPKFGRKWIETQLLTEAREADRLIEVQEFEARAVARGVDLEELYKRERRLSSENQACFITGPFKLIVTRNMPIAKKHHYVRLKMGGQKPVTCDRLGFLGK